MENFQLIVGISLLLACALVCHGDVRLAATSTNVEEHDRVELTCTAPGSTTGITWFLNGQPLNEGVSVLTENGGNKESKVTIEKMEHENEGDYTCKTNGDVTSNVVKITATHHEHHITASQTRVSVADGSSLVLTCQADIHTDVVWYKGQSTHLVDGKDGVTITVVKDPSNHLLTSKLTIKGGNDLTGPYTCQSAHIHDHDDEDKVIINVVRGGVGQADTSSAVTYALQSPTALLSVLLACLLVLVFDA